MQKMITSCSALEFQFLLGRLETKELGLNRRATKKFQFLLGRLETWCAIRSKASTVSSFNSS